MAVTADKELLHRVIDSLPAEKVSVAYNLFFDFINDYIDSHLSMKEHEEHLRAVHDIGNGEFVALRDLPE